MPLPVTATVRLHWPEALRQQRRLSLVMVLSLVSLFVVTWPVCQVAAVACPALKPSSLN